MIQRCENLRLSTEPRQSLRVRRKRIWQHLQGIVPLERCVMRSPNLTHAAFANEGGDFVGADPRAGIDGHVRGILRQAVRETSAGGDDRCACGQPPSTYHTPPETWPPEMGSRGTANT